ncbi:microtubule-associated tumor suppressor candidate 2 isoform X1 [Pygocentrus nattereri]|uniref:microtubule-associated tumor suppressor candidate 2 isoform X1 n=1 Tax=Pygocentrus nattereri TaxID=42514 RepID=UPI0008149F08|nr:microtubule-associated tumor suppressor candidate 2 isoform X1 [Pygocentrus nattereri]XP_017552304.1 microtubule-associated tumor suppressor candidate 2 isoform X1 [Pygocentrus nattereri]
MSMSDKLVEPVGSTFQESHGELRNNNRCAEDSLDGDTNANQIQSKDSRTMEESSFVSHSEEQDKIIIWGTDSQYDDPELAEFEMLECQELEAYLVESEDNYVKHAEGIPGKLYTNITPTEDPQSPSKNEASQADTKEQENVSYKLIGKETEICLARAEVTSDNEVFVSCHSTMSSLGGSFASALENAGQTQTAESWPAQTGPYRTLSEDLTIASQSFLTLSDKSRSSLHVEGTHVDLNLNTTTLPEEPLLEAQDKQPAENVLTYKETSGLLENGINECNPSITNAKNEHNDTGHASEDSVGHQEDPVEEEQTIIRKECKHPDAKNIAVQQKSCQPFGPEDNHSLSLTKNTHDSCHELKSKPSQSEENFDMNHKSSKPGSKGTPNQCAVAEPKLYQKQASFETSRSSSPSSLERRKPWCSPSSPATPPSPKNTGSPRRRLLSSPAKTVSARASSQEPTGSPQRGTSGLKPPSKSYLNTGIPKPVPSQPLAKTESPQTSSSPQKPKNVRPKIITYVRKSPQAKPHSVEGPYETSTLPSRLTAYTSSQATKEQKVGGPKGSPVLSSSNILYDKYRQELQKGGNYSPPGLMVSGIRPPSHTVPHKLVGKSESFHGELPDRYMHDVGRGVQHSAHEVAGVYRSPRALRPQLGLGAVTRQPTTKTRMIIPGQRSASPLSHAAPAGQLTYCYPDPTAGDVKKPLLEVAPKSLLPKPGQSGLRPPGFSHLPAARLAAFGFVRSASVSSVSSNQSNDSTHSDPCQPTNRPGSGSEETILPRSYSPSHSGSSRLPNCSSPQPLSGHTPTRRSLLPPPHGSPVAARKEFQRDGEATHPLSSPKRFAVVSPKPQSPVRQKSCVGRLGGRVDGVDAERERLLVQGLRERCEEQARQITSLQDKLRKASLCMDVLAITTQQFCHKSENAEVKERELSLELSRIRDEVVVSVGRWERLQGEKAELERSFEQELRKLKEEQQKEQQALQERLREEQRKETELLQKQQSSQLQQLRSQHHHQVEEMSESHEAAMLEMEAAHNATLATLQEEHARTIKNLKMAHEQQKKSLEEEFEKLRLSLQDQVDTLTFQNRSLRDRAKRFEEALRRSTDEQIVDALAPYQHIEEDLKSLKQVLEMKNQQIHQQELKISELEKLAQKNVLLEERVQVLQQQNEDLKARIDLNLAASRQLSEENANLQEYVEKESNEKKRLSRTNEELLWRLQTGELSPRMSPNQSPLHRPSPGPASPSHPPLPR